ncbi:MAG: L,D-transpeptidase family protein [Methylococcaceae bacterium]|nr:L,D-transpeptidase family protein [Methylococcaceae bacterium]MCI0733647.1 L,D-transpeptidase family protein [Methylococcaceae bacterium]
MTTIAKLFIHRSAWLVILALICVRSGAADETSLNAALRKVLNRQAADALGIEGRRMTAMQISEALLKRYREQDLRPVWVTPEGPGERAAVLYETLKSAPEEGLRSEDYRVSELGSLWPSRKDEDLAKLEILLSVGLAAYMADAREGRADPRKLATELSASAQSRRVDPVDLAVEAVHAEDLGGFLASQPPAHVQYRRLKKALSEYRALAAEGEWQAVPGGETLKPGMESERIPIVRQRLIRSADLSSGGPDSRRYDPDLETAVKRFQKRYHLDGDGAIGKKTVAAMNIPISQLIRRITINMERWRWLSRDLGDRRIFVNIAGFYLQGSHDGSIDLSMPVIVGEKYHKTPVFSASIQYLEFNPFWNIPSSIASDELYPELLKDRYHLKKKNIRMFLGSGQDAIEVDSSAIDWARVGRLGILRYRLRQDPGPKNSLGNVKFMFPNRFNVYLHDTPTQHLFKRSRRDFSHGCIRVSRPLELASYLLGGTEKGWDIEKMKKIIESRKRTVVNLEKPYPIHILYRTAAVDENGLVYFADDVYERDRMLEEALF